MAGARTKNPRGSEAGALYTRHVEAVKTLFRRIGIEADDIDDLIQDVFVVASRKAAEVPRGENDALYWLLEVARKVAANFRRLYHHEYELLDPGLVDDATDVEVDPELRVFLGDALSKLDEEDRKVLFAHIVHGESLREMAQWLGLSRSAAHLRLEEAREKLRFELEAAREEAATDEQPPPTSDKRTRRRKRR